MALSTIDRVESGKVSHSVSGHFGSPHYAMLLCYKAEKLHILNFLTFFLPHFLGEFVPLFSRRHLEREKRKKKAKLNKEGRFLASQANYSIFLQKKSAEISLS